MDRLEADAVLSADESVTVQLAGHNVEVLPLRQWRSSGVKALREGDFEVWSQRCLAEGSRSTWLDVDPTIAEIEAMFEQWSRLTGQSPGESPASRR
jgi:hypothetical protein